MVGRALRGTAFAAVLFFFTGLVQLRAAETLVGDLTIQEVELSAVIEYFAKKNGQVILPNDGVYDGLKPRKAKLLLPKEFKDVEMTSELWEHIYQSMLSIYNYTLVKKGDFYRLIPVKDAIKEPTPIIDDDGFPLNEKSERIVTRVITLKHVVSDVVRPLFRYVSEVSTPLALPDKKTIVITASEADLKYFDEVLAIFDKPKELPFLQSYTMERAIPSQVKNHITNYFNIERARKKGAKDAAQQAFILPDDSTGRLLVSAVAEDHKTVKFFIEFFDRDMEDKTVFRPIEIYKLKNSDAESVAKKLDQVLKARKTNNAKEKKEEDIPTIVPFEELNALIISVQEPETFSYVRNVIEMLDIKRNQVYIASTIVEVNNDDGYNFAATIAGGAAPDNNNKGGIIGLSDTGGAGTPTFFSTGSTGALANYGATLAPNLGSGLTLALPYGSLDYIPLVIRAAEIDSNVNVLANPSIICDDNEHAVIEITEERQFNTVSQSSSTTTSSFGGFNEAGIVLDIKPTISSDSFLKLEITQNVDRFTSDVGQDQVRNKRKATTVVTIPNKTSVVIGGLTEMETRKSSSKTPVLHKVPLLGELFKSRSKSFKNNTLYFFITPEIISKFDQLGGLSDRFVDRMAKESSEATLNHPIFKELPNRDRQPEVAPPVPGTAEPTPAPEKVEATSEKPAVQSPVSEPAPQPQTMSAPEPTPDAIAVPQSNSEPGSNLSTVTAITEDYGPLATDILDRLKVVFSQARLRQWISYNKAQELAQLIMEKRGTSTDLLPSFTQGFFELDKLDYAFSESLALAHMQMKTLPPSESVAVAQHFHQHLVEELGRIPSRKPGFKGRGGVGQSVKYRAID